MTSNQESLTNSKLFLLFAEIKKGYSKRNFRGSPIFIKHLGIIERSYFDYRYQEFYEHAVKQGILTEQEALNQCIKDEFWTSVDEQEISNLKDYIERLNLTKKNLFKAKEIKVIESQIRDERTKLIVKLTQRRDLLGKTAEEYAGNRSNDYIIYESFFKDEELKNKLFSLEDFEDMTYESLIEYILFYNDYMKEFAEINLQKITLLDFFHLYFLVLDYPTEFFGKPMVDLTDFQTRLILYGKIFKNIFESVEHIPDHVRQDPEALFQYNDKSKAKKNFESKTKSNSDASASMVFGASKEEVAEMGGSGKSLNQIMKEKKVMNMEELMKLHGDA